MSILQCPQCLREYRMGEAVCPRDGTPLAPPTLYDAAPFFAADEDDPELGTVLAEQYRLTEVIGEGGMGLIYKARQEHVGRDVAVKVLRARYAKDETVVRRFENEARIISQLRHPNTIRLYDYQRMPNGGFFIVTEYLRGMPLIELLRREGALPVGRTVSIAEQICASLSEAHGAGIVHRDLKPANIFLDHIGGEDVVKVLDFGIAKMLQGAAVKTQANLLMGTPAYMSPEQIRGQAADARSDIYSLGVLVYQMLTGRTPFLADNQVALLLKQVNDPPPRFAIAAPSRRDVHPEMERLVLEMLSKSAARRPASVTLVRERLRHIGRLVEAERPRDLPASEWPTETTGAPSLAMLERQRPVPLTHPVPVISEPVPGASEPELVERTSVGPAPPDERPAGPTSIRIGEPVEAKDHELWVPLEEDSELAIRRVVSQETSDLEIQIPADVQAAAAAALGRPPPTGLAPMAPADLAEPPRPAPDPRDRPPLAIFPDPEALIRAARAAASPGAELATLIADEPSTPGMAAPLIPGPAELPWGGGQPPEPERVRPPPAWRKGQEPVALLAGPAPEPTPDVPEVTPFDRALMLSPRAHEPRALQPARGAPVTRPAPAAEPRAEAFLDEQVAEPRMFARQDAASRRLALWGIAFAVLALLLVLAMWLLSPTHVPSAGEPLVLPDLSPEPAPAPEPGPEAPPTAEPAPVEPKGAVEEESKREPAPAPVAPTRRATEVRTKPKERATARVNAVRRAEQPGPAPQPVPAEPGTPSSTTAPPAEAQAPAPEEPIELEME